MMTIIGMFFQLGLVRSIWLPVAVGMLEVRGYAGEKPLTFWPLPGPGSGQHRAVENELDVQGPVGFWDPAGFTADENEENFVRHRQADLKHGRIVQLAATDYIARKSLGSCRVTCRRHGHHRDVLPGRLCPQGLATCRRRRA